VLRAPLVFDQSVAIQVAVPFDPAQRALHLRPQIAEHLEIAGPVGVVAHPDIATAGVASTEP
jgi:hypothetical protein